MRRTDLQRSALAALLALCAATGSARAQDLNIMHPVHEIEAKLTSQPFKILQWTGSRRREDRTQRALVSFPDSLGMWVKFAVAPEGGTGTFNNEPRYELAAYEIQKLFLEESEYVVPPTVIRAFPLAFIREQMADVRPTFRNSASGTVLVALQYWLQQVQPDSFWNRDRARADTVYARHVGNMNILTHVIRHQDNNVGNFLISRVPETPRVFSVDNGVAFNSEASDRGFEWRDLRVERFSRATVERLRGITRAMLDDRLGVLVEFETRGNELVLAERTPNFAPTRGVRMREGRVQIGLTRLEIEGVDRRIRELVKRADDGKLKLF